MARYNRKEVTGRMRNQVRFLKPLASRGPSGEQVQEWIISGLVFADFETRRTGTYEKEEAMRLQSFQSALFHIRYAGTVYTDMRILFDRKEWDILSVRPDSTFTLLTIEAQVRSPRELAWVAPDGQDYVGFDGQPWLFSEAGDLKTVTAPDAQWTDSAGIAYSGPSDPTYQDESGSLWQKHSGGDKKDFTQGFQQWSDKYGLLWQPQSA